MTCAITPTAGSIRNSSLDLPPSNRLERRDVTDQRDVLPRIGIGERLFPRRSLSVHLHLVICRHTHQASAGRSRVFEKDVPILAPPSFCLAECVRDSIFQLSFRTLGSKFDSDSGIAVALLG